MVSVARFWVMQKFRGLHQHIRHIDQNWRNNASHAHSQIPPMCCHARFVIHSFLDLLTDTMKDKSHFDTHNKPQQKTTIHPTLV